MKPQQNDNPLFSVCIPAYNGGAGVVRAVESVLEQQFEDADRIECVVVDDLSTDGSPELLQRFTNDPRFRLIRNETNLGLTKNWTKALSQGRGEVVAQLHQDDWLLPGALEAIANVFQARPEVVFFSPGQIFVPGNGDPEVQRPRGRIGEFSGRQYEAHILEFVDCPAPSTAYFRRSALRTLDPLYDPEFRFFSELELYLRLAQSNPEALFVHDKRLMLRRSSSRDQFSRRYPGYRILDTVRVIQRYTARHTEKNLREQSNRQACVQVEQDMRAILRLGDVDQLHQLFADGPFQAWLGSDPAHREAVSRALEVTGAKLQKAPAPQDTGAQPQVNQQTSEKAAAMNTNGTNRPRVDAKTILNSPYFRTPLLIVGFHHSGTRLIAKLLDDAGVFQVANTPSHEWTYIQRVNDKLLKAWNDPVQVRSFVPRPDGIDVPELAATLGIAGYDGSTPWLQKDPRTCATLPQWLEQFPEAKVLHIVRDPLDVLGTLREPYARFTPGGVLPQEDLIFWGDLWNSYIEKIRGCMGTAKVFLELRYEDLVADPATLTKQVLQALGWEELHPSGSETEIQRGRTGLYQKWIEDSRLDPIELEKLELVVGGYRRLYGYAERYQALPGTELLAY